MTATAPTLTPDIWLGDQLGRRAWRFDLPDGGEEALHRALHDAANLLDAEPSFAHCKAPVDAVAAIALLTRHGFRLVDTNVAFAKPCGTPAPDPRCRLAVPEDEDTVAAIAAASFVYTRFHLDPWIPAETANRIKEQWTRNYFRGKRGDKMVVAEVEGRIAGFNLLLRGSRGERVIDLIGVHPDFRRQGLGRALCLAAELHADGAAAMLVGTQVANVPSVRLYEFLGYRLAHAHHVFHRHHPG